MTRKEFFDLMEDEFATQQTIRLTKILTVRFGVTKTTESGLRF